MIPRLFAQARKVVFKFGSNTLADDNGRINTVFMGEFAEQAAGLVKKGKQIALVSSGAQVAGLSTMDKWARKKDIHYRQALCAVGQVELMGAWSRAFAGQGLHIAQILLTQDDFGDQIRTLNMRNTLFTLVDEGVIPIINENDSVSVEEIKIGDNDTLAAQSAILWSADLLILFTDIDGLYTKNPAEDPGAEFVAEIRNFEELKKNITVGSAGNFGTGGIATKISAAERAAEFGIPTVIANGRRPGALEALATGAQRATAFLV
ncbi:MAG: glutamate 5-kinase [Treponema sp.]|nr:glutamate 5-kinase [Treponema sp.]